MFFYCNFVNFEIFKLFNPPTPIGGNHKLVEFGGNLPSTIFRKFQKAFNAKRFKFDLFDHCIAHLLPNRGEDYLIKMCVKETDVPFLLYFKGRMSIFVFLTTAYVVFF